MSLFICSLNTGSNGNCFYVGNHTEAVLIDAGISCRETERRMTRANLSMAKVKAIFITHEHQDHINGVNTLSKKYNLPVYITTGTLRQARLKIQPHLIATFKAYLPVKVGNLSVLPFPKYHDASDPHSFIIEHNKVKVGVFTDIGMPCRHVRQQFEQCHAAFLESNYDEEMLRLGSYPYYLKERIRGDSGHLSNVQAHDLFMKHKPPFMSHLLLSHLSANNNSIDIVRSLFEGSPGNTKIMVATREKETPVYHVRNTAVAGEQVERMQLSLFES